MREAHLDLSSLRCPRCAGQLVLRLLADERGRGVQLTLDSACVACGVSPWAESDQRTVIFTPGASLAAALAGVEPSSALAEASEDLGARLSAAQSRIDSLLRREEQLERDLSLARASVQGAAAAERRRLADGEGGLRAEISRLEGLLADARAEVRRAEEATRAELTPGLRAIELE